MARPKTAAWWVSQAWAIVAEHPRASAAQVAAQLATIHKQGDAPHDAGWPPAARTVGEILKAMPPLPAAEYGPLRWPDSLGTESLPWEAGRAVVELLHMGSASVREGVWYWRLTLAVPELDRERRREVARRLTLADMNGDTTPRSENVLAYLLDLPDCDIGAYGRPWASGQAGALVPEKQTRGRRAQNG